MTPTYPWTGRSGTAYHYEIYLVDRPMADVPGNYILCRLVDGRWQPLYVGEAESLAAQCSDDHEQWRSAIGMGATHLHAKVTRGGEQMRCDEANDLREAYNSPLNDQ